MTFDDAIMFVINELEGGAKVVKDQDGITKYGICSRYYPDVDVANLTLKKALDLYRDKYWHAVNGDELPDAMRLLVFDTGINCGVGMAGIMLQKSINTMMPSFSHVDVDGEIGPQTIKALRVISYEGKLHLLALNFMARRLDHYFELRYKRPREFGGWINRMSKLMREMSKG